MRRLLLAALLCLLAGAALAQSFQPFPVQSNPKSGTIATGGTFQFLLPYNSGRRGGWIQNDGTGTMYVFLANKSLNVTNNAGCVSAATQAASAQIAPPTSLQVGDRFQFAYAGLQIHDAVCITGTGSDPFSYTEQVNGP